MGWEFRRRSALVRQVIVDCRIGNPLQLSAMAAQITGIEADGWQTIGGGRGERGASEAWSAIRFRGKIFFWFDQV